jgi:hemolysin activation/secretion protein/AraC-like DNA-binding protein
MATSLRASPADSPTHLTKFERIILNGGEWNLQPTDWLILQLVEGVAYSFENLATKELALGGILLCPPKSRLAIIASQLGRAVFRGTTIHVNSLMGFLTALERQCLESDVARECTPFLVLPADNPGASQMRLLLEPVPHMTLGDRLAIVQTFSGFISRQLSEALTRRMESEKNQQEAKGRLRQLVARMSEAELSKLSIGDLAKMLHCCERHASRLFRDEFGSGFLSYVSDLRLKLACRLLLQKELKIIDVALESGYGSLGHFNYVFKRRHRMTPTAWRDRQLPAPRRVPRAEPMSVAMLVVCVVWFALGILTARAAPAGGTPSVPAAKPPAPASVKTNSPQELKFRVDRYDVQGNTLLSSNRIDKILKPYTGPSVGIGAITNAMSVLQTEYFQRGYVTVKVSAPPQKVADGVVVFQATEGRLAALRIIHNHYFSSNNIVSALPYVRSMLSGHRILNAKIFQTELDRANANPDRQIAPEIRPGLEPGTSALVLDVKDRIPLHARADLDNFSPPGTPELRINANASYDNLWQLNHSIGVQYGFSPDKLKPSLGNDTHIGLNPVDTPDVTYYSGFYRAPLGPPVAVEDQIAADQTRFGYNETTRQFTPPPASGSPEVTAYGSRSTTGPTIYGPKSLVVGGSGTNNLLSISQQLITQQYTAQTTAGGRISFPLPNWSGIQSSWSIGMDYKNDKVVTLPTNYFYYTTTTTHGNGSGGGTATTSQSTIAIPGVATYPNLNYTPLFLGWTGAHQDHWFQKNFTNELWSRIDGGLSLVAGMGGTFAREKEFPILIADSKQATTEFVAVRPLLSRTQVLPGDFSAYGSLAGQWANEPLVNLEQFELGGNSSVRGYREGELYSDCGWVGQVELRSPFYWRGANFLKIGTQLTAFMDYGQGYALDSTVVPKTQQSLWGAGVGANFRIGAHVESHVIIGWPLIDSAFTTAGHERIMFSLSAQL